MKPCQNPDIRCLIPAKGGGCTAETKGDADGIWVDGGRAVNLAG